MALEANPHSEGEKCLPATPGVKGARAPPRMRLLTTLSWLMRNDLSTANVFATLSMGACPKGKSNLAGSQQAPVSAPVALSEVEENGLTEEPRADANRMDLEASTILPSDFITHALEVVGFSLGFSLPAASATAVAYVHNRLAPRPSM